ncbi:MAG: carbohydrate kinase family protein [Candidatus Limiplasma sp.]|nr:carbohydrate kinase family protein [Candidatus Limiplasma sp.]
MKAHPVAVIGASNVDISATSLSPLVSGDSNPGKVEIGFGGVGRNIAENLCRLGQSVSLITAYGEDPFGQMLRGQAQELGLDVSLSLRDERMSSSLYVCVNQPEGEMAVAVSDMEVCGGLSPDFFQDKLLYLEAQEAIVADTNLPAETLAFLGRNCQAPLFVDTVSIPKARKLKPILSLFTGIKTNRSEAEVLTGLGVRTEREALEAAKALHHMGVGYVFLTMGSHGALVSDGREAFWMPPMTYDLVNTTGCGDAFFAGALWAWLKKPDALSMLRHGLGMAALCAAHGHSVSPRVSPQSLGDILKKHHKEARSYAIC